MNTTAAVRKTPKGGSFTRENDIRWGHSEWEDVARIAVQRIAKHPEEPLGEVINTAQKRAIPSRRWKPLDELSNAGTQTKFYAACKRAGYAIEHRPPRVAGAKAIQEPLRWTERECLLLLRRVMHLEKSQPTASRTELLAQAQALELPEDRRYEKRQRLSQRATFWDQQFEPLKNNLWLLEGYTFHPDAKTYEEAQGLPPKAAPETPKAAPQTAQEAPQAAAAPEPVPVVTSAAFTASLPPLPPPIPPAALSAPIVPPSGPALDGLASGIASALNSYIATRDAAITAHVMQSVAAGPIADAIAAHITHALAGTIADAVGKVVSQIVPRIVAAELAAGVQHISTATGPINGPAQPAPAPAGEPPPVLPVLTEIVKTEPAKFVGPKAPKAPKHNPEPTPSDNVIKRLRIDLVGTERMGAVRSVMGHLNGAGRYVELHPISQDASQYRPNKGTPVVVFEGFSSHAITARIKAAGADMHLAGKGMIGAAKCIKQILAERGYIAAA